MTVLVAGFIEIAEVYAQLPPIKAVAEQMPFVLMRVPCLKL